MTLSRYVAAIALTWFRLGLGFRPTIGRKRASDINLILELAFRVPPDVTLVAFMRLNESAFACRGFLCSRFLRRGFLS